MINPFSILNNKRYTLYGRTIIIKEVLPFNVIWYYLDEWWPIQSNLINLYNSSKWWFILHAQKYKFDK